MEKMNPVVTALRDDIRRRQQVVQHIASLEEQLDSDRICGAWLAAQGTLTASLRRIGTATYRMLVYDHTLCYRRLVQDAVVTLRRHRLLFGEEEDCGANRVEYDPAAKYLGRNGKYIGKPASAVVNCGASDTVYDIRE